MNNESDRGMIKWAPFQSLHEQASYLSKMRHSKAKVERPLISSDIASSINDALQNYHGGPVSIRYYEKGFIKETDGTIEAIDALEHSIRFNGKRILFKNILGIQINDATEYDAYFMD